VRRIPTYLSIHVALNYLWKKKRKEEKKRKQGKQAKT